MPPEGPRRLEPAGTATALASPEGRAAAVGAAREGRARRWRRRAITLPAVFAGLALWLAALPVVLPLALASDLGRRSRLSATRLALYGGVWLGCEAWGLLGYAAVRLWHLGGREPERAAAALLRLQVVWAGALFGGARRLFGLTLDVEGAGAVAPGPILVFSRHASIVDTLLPALLVSGRAGLHLRYVLKRELLVDPCLDVVGQRLPNVFVHRASGQSEREIAAIRALASGLGADEGVLIFPEGTRASPERRRRALARLEAAGDAARLERARALRRLLPPRSGGPLALLAAAPMADVVLLAHAGLDGITRVKDALSGALVGRHIEVSIRRVPRVEVPTAAGDRMAWLDARWAELDAWVDARLAPGGPGGSARPAAAGPGPPADA